jgi:hypothetical protein
VTSSLLLIASHAGEVVATGQTVSVELAVCSYRPFSFFLLMGLSTPSSLSVKYNRLISMLRSEIDIQCMKSSRAKTVSCERLGDYKKHKIQIPC